MKQAFWKLHISVLLAGCTGLFGKVISLNEGLLVWYRLIFTVILTAIFLAIQQKIRRVSLRDFFHLAGTGAILAFHWLFFYGSIKASNVSIGVVCFSSVGFFTAILEPMIYRSKISSREILLSLLSLCGVLLIFSFDMRYRLGIALGIVSSALAALFTIVNKRVSANRPTTTVLLYEMIGGLLFVSFLMPFYTVYFPAKSIIPAPLDFFYLFLFAFFCTVVLYILQIQSLKKISAFTFNLTYNLEPVYSIVLAMLLLGEAKELNAAFYAGIILIITSLLMQMISYRKSQRIST
ncbi:MAG: DMT family transporter [Tannerella sp.]|jgi:drug/metabolite transporter (DMT)-like permease|nr:DMT family transporter [Tannerella sp.]